MDDFARLQTTIQSALVDTTRSAAALAAEDLPFHRTVDPSLSTSLDAQNARLLSLASRLLGSATANADNVRPTLRDIDDVESNWTRVVDVVDSLLERADIALDEFTGAVKRLSPREQVGFAATRSLGNGILIDDKTPVGNKPTKPTRISAALRSQDIEKPQLTFENKPSNYETKAFKPLLQSKPHASVALETAPIATDEDTKEQYVNHITIHPRPGLDHVSMLRKDGKRSSIYADAHFNYRYPHPYQLEIEQYNYPATVYTHAEPTLYHPFESTTATFVDTEEALDEMLQELKKAKEIAIDLEHHDQRSYIGIVCLMQISTRDRDWIVDTLVPWRRKLQALNEVFADPTIVKVMHGAHMDMIWLQRDLGLYVVGLFDTHHASRALGYTGGSYAFLLQKFTGVQAQKQYQTADWRIRPLPQELLDYARSDTHYLMYIYDNMRNELIEKSDFSVPDHEKDKVHDVCQRSKEYALQRYEYPVYDVEKGQGGGGWYKLVARTSANLSKQEFAVFRGLHKWRDEVGREQDDSVNYVMPNHMIFTLSRAMPSTRAELLSVAQPATQTVRLRADELVATIAKAKKDGENGPEMLEYLAKVDPYQYKKSLEKAAAQSAAQFEGVAKYTSQTRAPPITNNLGTMLPIPLRSGTSMFWGGNSQQQSRVLSTVPDVQLSVPMPPLNSEVFSETAALEAAQMETPAAPSPEPQPEEPQDDTFILKQLGRNKKRKLDDSAPTPVESDALATQTDEVTIDPANDRAFQKAERKRLKKEAKAQQEVSAPAEDEEAFDYTTAPSILNPPKKSFQELKAERKASKVKDPYKKSMDAPKGQARAQKERAGRSMTFKK
jgi:exosome complex exonuclease RRP6